MTSFAELKYTDVLAELYDYFPKFSDFSDVNFYVEICRESDGPILELGCGTGRVLIALARTGLETCGLDCSTDMLSKCSEKLMQEPEVVRQRIRLIQGSMTDFSLPEKFSSIIIPFHPFQHLISVADQLACLQCVYDHLHVGGMLVFDLMHVSFYGMSNEENTLEQEDIPETLLKDGRRISRFSRIAYTHRAEQYNSIELIHYVTDTQGHQERIVQTFPYRYFFRYEIEHLLIRAGFHISRIYGDFDKTLLTDHSPGMIFVCHKI
ncbi:MAG: class I SAM-dependent methyltransferase [Desulfuromonadaceae bacterium]